MAGDLGVPVVVTAPGRDTSKTLLPSEDGQILTGPEGFFEAWVLDSRHTPPSATNQCTTDRYALDYVVTSLDDDFDR